MSKLIIHADADPTRSNQGNCINDYCVGHFYIEVQGSGLNQGNFASFQKNSQGGILVGFDGNNKVTDEYVARQFATLGTPAGMYSKEIDLSDAQYSAMLSVLSNKIANGNGIYLPTANDCINFVQEIYQSAGQPNSFIDTYFSSAELDTLNIAGFFAKFIDNRRSIKQIAHDMLFSDSELDNVPFSTNAYLNKRAIGDANGKIYYLIENQVDTLTVPTPAYHAPSVGQSTLPFNINTVGPFNVNTDDSEPLTANNNVVFTGAESAVVQVNGGFNIIVGVGANTTVSYTAAQAGIDVDLSGQSTLTRTTPSTVDTLYNIQAVIGPNYPSQFAGSPYLPNGNVVAANRQVSFSGGTSNDQYSIYTADSTQYTLTDTPGNNGIELNGNILSGISAAVTNRQGNTWILNTPNVPAILTLEDNFGSPSTSGPNLAIISSTGDINSKITIKNYNPSTWPAFTLPAASSGSVSPGITASCSSPEYCSITGTIGPDNIAANVAPYTTAYSTIINSKGGGDYIQTQVGNGQALSYGSNTAYADVGTGPGTNIVIAQIDTPSPALIQIDVAGTDEVSLRKPLNLNPYFPATATYSINGNGGSARVYLCDYTTVSNVNNLPSVFNAEQDATVFTLPDQTKLQITQGTPVNFVYAPCTEPQSTFVQPVQTSNVLPVNGVVTNNPGITNMVGLPGETTFQPSLYQNGVVNIEGLEQGIDTVNLANLPVNYFDEMTINILGSGNRRRLLQSSASVIPLQEISFPNNYNFSLNVLNTPALTAADFSINGAPLPLTAPHHNDAGAIAAGILVPLTVAAAVAGGLYHYSPTARRHMDYAGSTILSGANWLKNTASWLFGGSQAHEGHEPQEYPLHEIVTVIPDPTPSSARIGHFLPCSDYGKYANDLDADPLSGLPLPTTERINSLLPNAHYGEHPPVAYVVPQVDANAKLRAYLPASEFNHPGDMPAMLSPAQTSELIATLLPASDFATQFPHIAPDRHESDSKHDARIEEEIAASLRLVGKQTEKNDDRPIASNAKIAYFLQFSDASKLNEPLTHDPLTDLPLPTSERIAQMLPASNLARKLAAAQEHKSNDDLRVPARSTTPLRLVDQLEEKKETLKNITSRARSASFSERVTTDHARAAGNSRGRGGSL